MPDFNIHADSIDVEQIMKQIRARIRDKRGVDYTDQEIQELAAIKLEKFLDPRGVRSDLLERFRQSRPPAAPPAPGYEFEDTTLFDSDKAIVRFIRNLLKPILKLFFNPNTLAAVLHEQAALNKRNAKLEEQRDAQRAEWDHLYYEVMHNLVLEMTRLGIEVKNMRMKVESVSSRLDFNERRARALETVVQYKPQPARQPLDSAQGRPPPPPPSVAAVPGYSAEQPPRADAGPGGEAQRRRRRRRRGRRTGGTMAANGQPQPAAQAGGGVEEPGDFAAPAAEERREAPPEAPQPPPPPPTDPGTSEQ